MPTNTFSTNVETEDVTKTLNVPSDRPVFRCSGIPKFNARGQRINPPCGQPASGIYMWETKSFSNIKIHKAALCATCGLNVTDQIRAYEDNETHELIYYKPNRNIRIIVRFNYEHATRPEPDRIAALPPVHRRRPNPRVVRHTLDDGSVEINSHMPRVWCEKCEAAVKPLVSETRKIGPKTGRLTVKRTSICSVCGNPTHNPDMT